MSRAALTDVRAERSGSSAPARIGLLERERAKRADDGRARGGEQAALEHRFGRLRVTETPAPVIQPKLRMGTPGDKYEREADRIAGHVNRVSQGKVSQTSPRAQSSGGRRLDSKTQSFMESRFGHSFDHVRVHTGAQADASGRAIDAKAYTVGPDIVFARGEYAPDTQRGRRLLAHELTHVLQQSPPTAESGGMEVSQAPEQLVQRARGGNSESARLEAELKELLTLKQELLDDIARAKQGDRAALRDALFSVQRQIDDVLAAFGNPERSAEEKRKPLNPGEMYGVGGLGLVTTGGGSGGKGPVVYDDPEFAGTPAHSRRMAELGGNLLASKHTLGPKESFNRSVKEHQRGRQVIEDLPETIKQSRDRLLRWPAEIAEQTVKSGAGFAAGFIDGMSTAELTDDQKTRLLRNVAMTSVFMPAVYAGMSYGIAKEARDTLAGLLELEEASAALSDLVGLVLSPGGETVARELGVQVAGQVKRDIDSMIEMSPPRFGFALGEKTGPILAGIVLAIVSGGAGAAARIAGILNRIPGGRKLIARLKGKRKLGAPPVSASVPQAKKKDLVEAVEGRRPPTPQGTARSTPPKSPGGAESRLAEIEEVVELQGGPGVSRSSKRRAVVQMRSGAEPATPSLDKLLAEESIFSKADLPRSTRTAPEPRVTVEDVLQETERAKQASALVDEMLGRVQPSVPNPKRGIRSSPAKMKSRRPARATQSPEGRLGSTVADAGESIAAKSASKETETISAGVSGEVKRTVPGRQTDVIETAKEKRQHASELGRIKEEERATSRGIERVPQKNLALWEGGRIAARGNKLVWQLKYVSGVKRGVEVAVKAHIGKFRRGLQNTRLWKKVRKNWNETHKGAVGFDLPERPHDSSAILELEIGIPGREPAGWLEIEARLQKYFAEQKGIPPNARLRFWWDDSVLTADEMLR